MINLLDGFYESLLPYNFTYEHELSNRVSYLQSLSKKTKWKRNRRKQK